MTSPPLHTDVDTTYALDANIFMSAWHDHYPIDLYPGFWECLENYSMAGRLRSIDRVRDEIICPDALIKWLDRNWSGSFITTQDQDVVNAFSEMQRWVQSNAQFLRVAKSDFAGTADGWLAAYAKIHGVVLVTNEVFDANIKRRVPLLNLCKRFGITYVNTVDMLRGIGVRFDLRPTM